MQVKANGFNLQNNLDIWGTLTHPALLLYRGEFSYSVTAHKIIKHDKISPSIPRISS